MPVTPFRSMGGGSPSQVKGEEPGTEFENLPECGLHVLGCPFRPPGQVSDQGEVVVSDSEMFDTVPVSNPKAGEQGRVLCMSW